LNMYRRKSSDEMNNAGNFPTPDMYGVGADSSEQLENSFPLERRNTAAGSIDDIQSPYMHLSDVSAPPVYAELHLDQSR